jgi:ABC-type phosphate transport system substrate-binding protein
MMQDDTRNVSDVSAAEVTRRRWLAALGSAGGALALAACGANATSTVVGAPTAAPSAAQPTAVPIPGSGIVTGPFQGEAKALTGAGSTFDAVLFTKWFDEYNRLASLQFRHFRRRR